jgi:antirestriction protein ArdC
MKHDIYKEISGKIISELKTGVAPWAKPWKAGTLEPINHTTRQRYSGINFLLCLLACEAGDYDRNDWLTYKQAQAIGANVRKGEKGLRLVYASQFNPKGRAGEDSRLIWFHKAFTVFNVDQIDGLTLAPIADVTQNTSASPEYMTALQSAVDATGAQIAIGGSQAYYRPSADTIQLPAFDSFFDGLDFYRTAFHELAHWTGHKSRLDRDQKGASSKESYAFEELVAEMGAAFTCARLGAAYTSRHADYIGAWIKHIEENPRSILKAASKGGKAADFILDTAQAEAIAA